ncbi:MAG: hypothetical protein LBH95_02595 [Oscillospiraceae bacterium]|nr:hypothetical protein [Oscillospiraceae bacterium]
MNWARAKTLLIALLLIVNLVLGGVWLYRELQVRTRAARAVEDLCAVLGQNGLGAKPEQIPEALALTYDVERSDERDVPSGAYTVHELPVWGQQAGFAPKGALSVTPVSGQWLWDKALPINNSLCFSAGHCLLKFTENWEDTGLLEQCALGFAASPIAPGVLRLKPCWRFVISGEEYFVPAA